MDAFRGQGRSPDGADPFAQPGQVPDVRIGHAGRQRHLERDDRAVVPLDDQVGERDVDGWQSPFEIARVPRRLEPWERWQRFW